VELADAIRRRRMVRSFSATPPGQEVLDALLASALRAPTAGNSQGWDAVVLEGPEQTGVFWQATTTSEWRQRSRRWHGLRSAPVVVVVLSNPGAYLARYAESDKARSGLGSGPDAWVVPYWDTDAAMAVMVLLLATVDAGLGACFLGNFRGEGDLKEALGVPDDRRYVGAVLIGQPSGEDRPSSSISRPGRAFEEVFHRGRW
jgi:nitroreductase